MSPINPNTIHNLSQFDPSKYGWTIGGGMADVLPPLERARRREGKRKAKHIFKHQQQNVVVNGEEKEGKVEVKEEKGAASNNGVTSKQPEKGLTTSLVSNLVSTAQVGSCNLGDGLDVGNSSSEVIPKEEMNAIETPSDLPHENSMNVNLPTTAAAVTAARSGSKIIVGVNKTQESNVPSSEAPHREEIAVGDTSNEYTSDPNNVNSTEVRQNNTASKVEMSTSVDLSTAEISASKIGSKIIVDVNKEQKSNVSSNETLHKEEIAVSTTSNEHAFDSNTDNSAVVRQHVPTSMNEMSAIVDPSTATESAAKIDSKISVDVNKEQKSNVSSNEALHKKEMAVDNTSNEHASDSNTENSAVVRQHVPASMDEMSAIVDPSNAETVLRTKDLTIKESKNPWNGNTSSSLNGDQATMTPLQTPETIPALLEPPIFDLDTYHMGQAGKELRSVQKFNLLNDIKPQDTNHFWDPKTMVTSIKIRFPLHESDDESDSADGDRREEDEGSLIKNIPRKRSRSEVNGLSSESLKEISDKQLSAERKDEAQDVSNRKESKEVSISSQRQSNRRKVLKKFHFFEETIRWNLADPSAPTTAEYAMNVANQFGLSWKNTLKLEDSINLQLQAYMKANTYMSCVTLKDAADKKRDLSILYAQAEKERSKGSHRLQSISGRNQGGGNKKLVFDSISFDPNVDTEYMDEVKKRLKIASYNKCCEVFKKKSVTEQSAQFGRPKINFVYDVTCHICRVYKPRCVRFSCDMSGHTYCDFHCKQRLGFSFRSLEMFNQRSIEFTYEPQKSAADNIIVHESETVDKVTSGNGNVLSSGKRVDDVSNKEGTALTKANDLLNIREYIVETSPTISSDFRSKEYTLDGNTLKCLNYFCRVCPICALICNCPRCIRRIEKVGKELKTRCTDFIAHDPDVIKKVDLDVWALAVNDLGSKESLPTSSKRRRILDVEPEKAIKSKGNINQPQSKEKGLKELMSGISLKSVPKVALSELPHEVAFGWKDGQKMKEDSNKGDGNVDYCLYCLSDGDLICCDKCPRSFHKECYCDVKKCISTSPPDNDEYDQDSWTCIHCTNNQRLKSSQSLEKDKSSQNLEKDKHNLNENSFLVSGDTFVKDMVNACGQLKPPPSESDIAIRSLAKICEMVTCLIQYDFGYIFMEPVTVPGYSKIIEKPMDLGTVKTNLIQGEYAKKIGSESNPSKRMNRELSHIDQVIVMALKDIERVWQNCFIFNLERSAVFRMAEVQRTRYNLIRKESIDENLRTDVVSAVKSFVEASDKARAKASSLSNIIPFSNRLPNFVKIADDGVLLPKPGSTFVLERNNSKIQQAQSRAIIVIDSTSNTIVRFFSTQRLAISACHLMVERGQEPGLTPFTDHFWRRFIKAASLDPTLTLFGYRWLLYDDVIERLCIFPGFIERIKKIPKTTQYQDNQISKREKDTRIVKVDTLSGAELASYGTIHDAFNDWLSTVNISTENNILSKDIASFQRQFIEGFAHIEGIRWKKGSTKASLKAKSVRSARRGPNPMSDAQKAALKEKKEREKIEREKEKKEKERERKELKARLKAEKLAKIPKPCDDHCHAWIRKQYCKRKLVKDGNYCVIHMRQLIDGNVASGLVMMSKVKGTLPPEKKRTEKRVKKELLSKSPSSDNGLKKNNNEKNLVTKKHSKAEGGNDVKLTSDDAKSQAISNTPTSQKSSESNIKSVDDLKAKAQLSLRAACKTNDGKDLLAKSSESKLQRQTPSPLQHKTNVFDVNTVQGSAPTRSSSNQRVTTNLQAPTRSSSNQIVATNLQQNKVADFHTNRNPEVDATGLNQSSTCQTNSNRIARNTNDGKNLLTKSSESKLQRQTPSLPQYKTNVFEVNTVQGSAPTRSSPNQRVTTNLQQNKVVDFHANRNPAVNTTGLNQSSTCQTNSNRFAGNSNDGKHLLAKSSESKLQRQTHSLPQYKTNVFEVNTVQGLAPTRSSSNQIITSNLQQNKVVDFHTNRNPVTALNQASTCQTNSNRFVEAPNMNVACSNARPSINTLPVGIVRYDCSNPVTMGGSAIGYPTNLTDNFAQPSNIYGNTMIPKQHQSQYPVNYMSTLNFQSLVRNPNNEIAVVPGNLNAPRRSQNPANPAENHFGDSGAIRKPSMNPK